VSPDPARDPFNAAVASVIRDLYVADGSQLTRVASSAQLSKHTLLRYLDGERDIRVAHLRKIATALNSEVRTIVAEAEGRLK
jgi:transcriptional regulator with XRE-family HTH domain